MGSGASSTDKNIEASVCSASDADLTATVAGLSATSRERLLVALGKGHGLKSSVSLLKEEMKAKEAMPEQSSGADGEKDSEVAKQNKAEGKYKGRHTYDDGIMGIYDDGNDVVCYRTTSTYSLEIRGDGTFQLDLHIQSTAGKTEEKYTITGESVSEKIVFPNKWEISIAVKDDGGVYLTSTENGGKMGALLLEACLSSLPEGTYSCRNDYEHCDSDGDRLLIWVDYLLEIRGDGKFKATLTCKKQIKGFGRPMDNKYETQGESVFDKTKFSNGWEISVDLNDGFKVYLNSTEEDGREFRKPLVKKDDP